MTLSAGDRLGPYEILGAGAMGESQIEQAASAPMTVVLNWTPALKR